MQSIYLTTFENITQEGVIEFISKSQNLFKLELNINNMNDRVVKHMANNCPKLILLNLSVENISFATVRYAISKLNCLQEICFIVSNIEDLTQVFADIKICLPCIVDMKIYCDFDVDVHLILSLKPKFKRITSLLSLIILDKRGKKIYVGFYFIPLRNHL